MTRLPDLRRAALAVVGATALALAACHVGPAVESFPIATQPTGAEVRLSRRGWKMRGELVAVRDSALVVREGRRLVLVPWARVDYLVVPRLVELYTDGRRPSTKATEQLRLVSRFPQDLTPAVERALLATLGREAMEVER